MSGNNLGAVLSQNGLQELRRRVIFLLIGIVIYRIGAHIPVPGLDPSKLAEYFNQHQSGLMGLLNMFSGGALSHLTILALNVMPYISASIIVQMFSTVLPSLQQLRKEGDAGRRKLNDYTRYGTVFLAAIQAVGITKMMASNGIALNPDFSFYFVSVVSLVTGTMFLMWLGEQMTERGIGNGISMIIFAGIVSRLPAAVVAVLEQVKEGQISVISLMIILVSVLGIIAAVVFMERGQRRITIHYAKRMQGRKMYAAQSSHLPLKINMAGVIPPIFASSLILFPAGIAKFFSSSEHFSWLDQVALMLSPGEPLYLLLFTAGILFFSFFYTALVFNPKDTSDNLKRSGAFIPGIRPGEQTARYVDRVMTRLTVVGAIYLALISLMPQFFMMAWNVPFTFGGTSLLIIVVVLMDFMAQVQAHLMGHQYESLMKKSGFNKAKV